MKTNASRLPGQYLAALRNHLKPDAKAGSPAATRLGRQAVVCGLETLDLARLHEQALTSLAVPGSPARHKETLTRRARAFFVEALAPIEKTHRAARKTEAHAHQLDRTLRQRTVESSASARHLKQGIARRQAAEAALQKSGQQRNRLLAESRRLREHLQHLTHEILSGQEDERRKISRQLHDEIAQTLLGINIRLLTLKNTAKANTSSLKKEIAGTQRLVRRSLRTVHQFAEEFGLGHET
jgi:signal transduction histidine kinase